MASEEPSDPLDGLTATEALQLAALQVIAATRTFLDVAEQAVRDPNLLGNVTAAVRAMSKGLAGTLESLSGGATGGPDGGRRDEPDPPVEHIDLG
jgi:hypothetical protein